MKLFFYYMFHSAKNALKKLFKTWFLVFFAVMIVGGLVLGFTIGTFIRKAEDKLPREELPPSEQTQEVPEDDGPHPEITFPLVELVAGGVVLLVFVMNALSADKGGAQIFQPADVNILFASPMKPQSVLLFRMVMQMGVSVLASIYILYQIPNLMRTGMELSGAVAVVLGWGLTLCTAQLIKMLCFVAASSHPRFKQNIRRLVYAVLLLILGGFVLFMQGSGLGWWEAIKAYFNAPFTRFIPFWGWIKGFIMFSIEKNVPLMLLCLGLLIVGSVGLAWFIWHMKADFYEEALQKATEKAEILAAAQSSENGRVLMKRTKDRAERLRRNAFNRGWGANVYFHKAVYNRFRFAHMGFLTKTLEFYLVLAVGTAVICRFVIETKSPYPVVLILAAVAFFRSLGNALKEDTRMWFFHMIPEDGWTKLCWSLAGDMMNGFLDVLPPLVIGLLIQGAPIEKGLLWLPLILSVTAYSTSVGTFIDLSVNVNAGGTLKQMTQVFFIYFGLLPDILIVGGLLLIGMPVLAALAGAGFNLALSALFLLFASLLMGRK